MNTYGGTISDTNNYKNTIIIFKFNKQINVQQIQWKGLRVGYYLYGSNDNINYTIILNLDEYRTSASVSVFYQYFKLVCSSWSSGGLMGISLKLMIPNIIIKHLIQDNNQSKSTNGIEIISSNNLPHTVDNFNTNGMSDLSKINKDVISKLIDTKYKIATYKK